MSLLTNLLAYWKLDNNGSGGLSLADSSGNGNTLTNNGGVALGTGKINGDATFDGSAQYLSNPSVATNFGTGGFTVSCWLRLTQYSDPFCIPWLIADPRVLPIINSEGLVSLIVGGGAESESTGYIFPLNTWTQVVFVRNATNGNFDFYINGSFVSSFTLGSSESYSSGQLLLGTADDNLGAFVPVGGLDEVGIWNRALSSAEVGELYNYGAGNPHPFSSFVPHKNIVPRANGKGKLGTDALRWAQGHFQTSLSVGGESVATASALQTGLDTKAALSHTHSASDITSGTLALARLNPLVARDDLNNNFTVGQSITAAANTSALTASYSVTGANTTALVDLSGTWNTTGVARGILLNITDTASNASSLLADFRVGGTSRFAIRRDGVITTDLRTAGAGIFSSAFFRTRSDGAYCFSSNSSPDGSNDLLLQRDAAGTLALRNGGTAAVPVPQNFRVYNWGDATNFERGFMRWNSNVLEIGTEAGGTGTARAISIQGNTNFASSVGFGQFITNIGGGIAYRSQAADPTTANLSSGFWNVYRNTTSGQVRLWCNNNGTMVSVALA